VPPKCAAEFLADHYASQPGASIPQLATAERASSAALGLRRQMPMRRVRSLIMIGSAEEPPGEYNAAKSTLPRTSWQPARGTRSLQAPPTCSAGTVESRHPAGLARSAPAE
jgi:hypothetical protein